MWQSEDKHDHLVSPSTKPSSDRTQAVVGKCLYPPTRLGDPFVGSSFDHASGQDPEAPTVQLFLSKERWGWRYLATPEAL